MTVKPVKASDISNKSKWYYTQVNACANRGLMDAPNGKFSPDSYATVSDFYKGISRIMIRNGYANVSLNLKSFNEDTSNKITKSYKDYEELLAGIATAGQGLFADVFSRGVHFNNNVISDKSLDSTGFSRNELSLITKEFIIHNWLDYDYDKHTNKNTFSIKDKKACTITRDMEDFNTAVNTMFNLKLLSLDQKGNFNPTAKVTRAQLAGVLNKLDDMMAAQIKKYQNNAFMEAKPEPRDLKEKFRYEDGFRVEDIEDIRIN